jgi:hypothetical protein
MTEPANALLRELFEDAHATRADQQPDDDQNDALQYRGPEYRDDSRDHKYNGDDP